MVLDGERLEKLAIFQEQINDWNYHYYYWLLNDNGWELNLYYY